MCETLQRLGYTVLQAADGHEALRILEQHGSVQVLLTDVIMPVMDGRELARRVSALRPGTKVVYMSGYTDETPAFYGLPQKIAHDRPAGWRDAPSHCRGESQPP